MLAQVHEQGSCEVVGAGIAMATRFCSTAASPVACDGVIDHMLMIHARVGTVESVYIHSLAKRWDGVISHCLMRQAREAM